MSVFRDKWGARGATLCTVLLRRRVMASGGAGGSSVLTVSSPAPGDPFEAALRALQASRYSSTRRDRSLHDTALVSPYICTARCTRAGAGADADE